MDEILGRIGRAAITPLLALEKIGLDDLRISVPLMLAVSFAAGVVVGEFLI